MLRFLVVGAGAVGGYFGALLAQAERNVTFLVRQRRREQLESSGLRIAGRKRNLELRPELIGTHEILSAYDVILLTVKAYSLESAMEDFSAAVGPTTMILPFLNGLQHLDLLTARFGAQTVLGGVCYVATKLDADGAIQQLADLESLTYGELSGEASARVKALDATLRGCGFEANLSDHIVQDMWDKWVSLASLGALTCLLRGSVGDIAAALGGNDLATRIVAECVSVAHASGHAPNDSFVAKTNALVTETGSSLTSSMYRDLLAGNAVEVEQILGDMVTRGDVYSLETPLLLAALVQLRVYQNLRTRAGQTIAAAKST
jgi:2-dehydropantoate 2-reductase